MFDVKHLYILKITVRDRNALIAWHGHYRSIESIIKIVDSS